MSDTDIETHPVLRDMVGRLREAAGDRLEAVVLYGPAAHGDLYEGRKDLHLMIVLDDLGPDSLAALHKPLARWIGKGLPMPRFFSPTFIAEAADVFPIEFLDIASHHVVLHGRDPLDNLEVHTDHLRIQCERELREKMLRLREGYIEAHGHKKALRKLMFESFLAFVNVFRGCLRLHGDEVPAHDADVVKAFCQQADLDPKPLERVHALRRGEDVGDAEALFRDYYRQLVRAVESVDRFVASGDKS